MNWNFLKALGSDGQCRRGQSDRSTANTLTMYRGIRTEATPSPATRGTWILWNGTKTRSPDRPARCAIHWSQYAPDRPMIRLLLSQSDPLLPSQRVCPQRSGPHEKSRFRFNYSLFRGTTSWKRNRIWGFEMLFGTAGELMSSQKKTFTFMLQRESPRLLTKKERPL